MSTTLQATGNTRPWIEALALFDRLADLAPEACEKELGTLPGENPELFRHVMTLLRAHWEAKGGAFLTLHAPPTGERAAMGSVALAPGAALGPYRLETPLGRGGMGEVWLARRSDGLFEAPVALKLLHAHLQTSTLRERFIREGRILGQLSHPNIARLLDAGSLPDQRLYLAIEYVEGERIDHWCDRAKQTIRGRVRLFLQVCDAVSHAHARLAVHRDLKPSNILVTPRGDIKLLDFGIAKLLESDQSASESTELTRLGGRALTPEYAAPEQILGKTITVGTDVYSLGMVLYGLLTGRRAYGHGTESLVELERAVVETEPPPPSQYPRTPGATLADDAASLRGMSGAELRDALRGDLDTIVLKALKKNPSERYASVAAFADDLRCHLEDRPVSAQPDSAAYRVSKFVRRNRLGVVAGAAVTAAVVAGVSGVVFQAKRAEVARDAAEAAEHRATLRSEEADDLIGFMLGDLKPQLEGLGRLELLDATVTKAMSYVGTGDLATKDERALRRRAQALTMLSELRTARGQFADATLAGQQALEAARALRERKPGDASDELLAAAIYAFGEPSLENGAFETTQPLTLEGVAIADGLLARPAPGRALLAARLHDQLGYTLAYGPAQDNPGAEAQWQRCIDLLRPLRSDGTPQELRYLLQCEGSRLINFSYHETPPVELLGPAITLVTHDGSDARARFPDDREILARVIAGMAASINPLSGLQREREALAVADEALALAQQAYAFEPTKLDGLRMLQTILRDRVAVDTRAGRLSPDALRARALHAADQLAMRDPENRDSLTMSATAILGLIKQIANDPGKRAEALALAQRASRTGRLDGAIELDLEPIASLELLEQALQPSGEHALPALEALRTSIKGAEGSDWNAARAYALGHVAEGDAQRGKPVSPAFQWVVRWLREQACARSSTRCPPADLPVPDS